jgi:hypothetical protein
MAKTESTAVNSLIELVQTNQARPVIDPSDDLFAAPIAPLPRSRAPGGTSQMTLPEHRPSVRTTTAPPSRGTTIPPIPRVTQGVAPPRPATLPEGTPPPALQARPSSPRPPTPRPSAPALPPPARRATPTPQALYAKAQTGPVNAQHQARIDMTGDMVRGEDWFEASRAVEKFEDETYVGTSPHVLQDRRAETPLIKKLILPAIGFIMVGALIGGFIAFNSSGKKPVVAKASIAHVTPATQPTAQNAAIAEEITHGTNTGVPTPSTESPNAATATANADRPEPPAPTSANGLPNGAHLAAAAPAETAETHVVQTTRGVVRLADVRIDSMPAGATVTLVEKTATGQKKSFLGTTPIATSLDPSRSYEVVLALQGRPEQTAKLDPAHTPHLQIALGKTTTTTTTTTKAAPARPAIAKAITSPKAAPAPKHHSAPKNEQLADPGFDSAPAPTKAAAAPAERAERPEKPAAGAAKGTLMISTKPPCEIVIDGKSTGLTTPQRAIPLPAGAHKVTLVNSGANINKTLMVQINADQPTKLVKDLIGS